MLIGAVMVIVVQKRTYRPLVQWLLCLLHFLRDVYQLIRALGITDNLVVGKRIKCIVTVIDRMGIHSKWVRLGRV